MTDRPLAANRSIASRVKDSGKIRVGVRRQMLDIPMLA